MPTNLLLLPLMAGYFFLRLSQQFHYRTQSLEGQKLLLWAGSAGLTFGLLSRLLIVATSLWAPGVYAQVAAFKTLLPVEYAGTAAFTIPIALVFAGISNFRWELIGTAGFRISAKSSPRLAIQSFFSQTDKRDYAIDQAVQKQQNELFVLINEGFAKKKLLSISLTNRKLYVGFAKRRTSLSPDDQFVELLPILSGYRDKDTLEFQFTTDYRVGDEGEEPLTVMFPLKDIQIANRFDLARFAQNFAEDGTPPAAALPLETDA